MKNNFAIKKSSNLRLILEFDDEGEDDDEEEDDEGMRIRPIIIKTDEELDDYPSDCFPDNCYKRFPILAGDDDAPFWQSWGLIRLKTFRLIENKYFETAVIIMILTSSLALVSIPLCIIFDI